MMFEDNQLEMRIVLPARLIGNWHEHTYMYTYAFIHTLETICTQWRSQSQEVTICAYRSINMCVKVFLIVRRELLHSEHKHVLATPLLTIY